MAQCQPGRPRALDVPGNIDENEAEGVRPWGAGVNAGLGDLSCDSLLGDALIEGVAETRFLTPNHQQFWSEDRNEIGGRNS